MRRADAQFYQVGAACILLPAGARLPDRPTDMAVRAEHIILGKTGFPATVRLVQPVGPFTYVTVAWDGGALTARVSGLSPLRPKDPFQVEIDPSGIMFFDRESENRLEFTFI
jgi:multiple sugar transport system ATP-binding protein